MVPLKVAPFVEPKYPLVSTTLALRLPRDLNMYLAIEGVIGVGKTTLARLLHPMFDAAVLLESFEENPFLSDFYSDRRRYAFQTQIFFLLSRYHQQRDRVPPARARGSLRADSPSKKAPLSPRLNLEGDELETYFKLHA